MTEDTLSRAKKDARQILSEHKISDQSLFSITCYELNKWTNDPEASVLVKKLQNLFNSNVSQAKHHKSAGIRILLVAAAIVCGLTFQSFGSIINKFLFGSFAAFADTLTVLAGFGVMGYLIYRWAIK
jgi:hypothetical protein